MQRADEVGLDLLFDSDEFIVLIYEYYFFFHCKYVLESRASLIRARGFVVSYKPDALEPGKVSDYRLRCFRLCQPHCSWANR
jgi:hypothetical protein